MSETTNHVAVEAVEFRVEGVETAGHAAERVGEGLEHAGHRLRDFAKELAVGGLGAVGLGLGLERLVDKAVEANKELGGVTKGITGTLYAMQGWEKGSTAIDRVRFAKEQSKEVVESLEEMEGALAVPLESLGAAYKTVAGPALNQLGMDYQDVITLTAKAAEASKVFGISTEQAANTMTRVLLTKHVSARAIDPFTAAIRDAIGSGKNLTTGQIYERMTKGMTGMKDAALEMSQGLGDSMFRVRDTIEDTLRDITKPTFKYLVDRIKEFDHWLQAAAGDGRKNIDVWADKLLSVVKEIESASKWVASHWKEIALVMATTKLAPSLSGLASGASIGGGLLAGGGKMALGEVGGALASLGAKASIATAGLTVFAVAVQAIADTINKDLDRRISNESRFGMTNEASQATLKAMSAKSQLGMEGPNAQFMSSGSADAAHYETIFKKQRKMAIGMARGMGIISDKNEVSVDAAKQALDLHGDLLSGMRDSLGVKQDQWMQRGSAAVAEAWAEFLKGGITQLETTKTELAKRKPPQFNFGDVHITQDFKDQDPDKVFMRVKSDIENEADNRRVSALSREFAD